MEFLRLRYFCVTFYIVQIIRKLIYNDKIRTTVEIL